MKPKKNVYKRAVCILILHPDFTAERKSGAFQTCYTRDAHGYPLHGLDVVPERGKPKPKYPLRDLVKLWQEAKQRNEADQRAEHWHCAYKSLNQEYLALKDRDLCLSCQRVKDETGGRDYRIVSGVFHWP